MSTAPTNLFGFGEMKTKILPKSSNAVSLQASHVCQGLLWLLNREKCIDLQYKTEKTQCSSQCIQSYKYTICKFKF